MPPPPPVSSRVAVAPASIPSRAAYYVGPVPSRDSALAVVLYIVCHAKRDHGTIEEEKTKVGRRTGESRQT